MRAAAIQTAPDGTERLTHRGPEPIEPDIAADNAAAPTRAKTA